MQSLNTVEQPGFRMMLLTFNPKYEVPRHSYFTCNSIPSLYNEVRDKFERNLVTEATYFSSTINMWTSRVLDFFMIHYMTEIGIFKLIANKH